ncbi:MAG: histidine phosphatase family protein [Lachnospiraceae bacterium]|nr:histidine phosphatase family protein [Lachnospiraceae bacterium]
MANKKVYLIRHGVTIGNIEKRYIGLRTDQPLCEEGIRAARELRSRIPASFYRQIKKVYSGPMLRARETARILFDDRDITVIDELTETDFGYFEGKNYADLNGDAVYQKWIDSNGEDPIPGAEKREDLIARSLEGLKKALGDMRTDDCIAIVCHGGNIMGILSHLTGENYFHFMTKNLDCWVMDLETDGKNIVATAYDRVDLRNFT